MNYTLTELLDLVVQEKASDLHLHVDQAPVLRISGSMLPVDGPKLTPAETEAFVKEITPEHHLKRLQESGGCDFGFSFGAKARFRVSCFKARSGNGDENAYGIVLRQIPNNMFSLEKLGLSDKVKSLLRRQRGLILVTGPTGSGKTTTLASMLNWINENEERHIITIEDPIEYFHDHKRSVVTQREIGRDVGSFSEAIRAALRQDPDIILVGEMRDLETITAAVSAAETGHLVFATLHTTGAARTVDRIVDAFPADTKEQIRMQLASSLVAVISQVLCRRKNGGRVAGYEIMINTDSAAALIRDNKTYRITSEIQTGGALGMRTLDGHLLSLVSDGVIDASEAITYAQVPDEMRQKLREIGY
ncbi:MAG: type IV pilus twitching motility protein PilT [Opitutales bacterium]|nr:type IV pilus twitching motility protein PilT [Opitutales bacterium]